jgi:DNA mismatch endonuclease (patch repair protein)
MSQIKSKDTKPEMILRKALWKRGFRYRIHRRDIGNADIVFIKEKVAIFVDGEFWHGYSWKVLGKVPPKKYWQEKIKRNMKRDLKINKELKQQGWTVIRFWGDQVIKSHQKCINKILLELKRE